MSRALVFAKCTPSSSSLSHLNVCQHITAPLTILSPNRICTIILQHSNYTTNHTIIHLLRRKFTSTCAKATNEQSYNSFPVICLHNIHKDNFTFSPFILQPHTLGSDCVNSSICSSVKLPCKNHVDRKDQTSVVSIMSRMKDPITRGNSVLMHYCHLM